MIAVVWDTVQPMASGHLCRLGRQESEKREGSEALSNFGKRSVSAFAVKVCVSGCPRLTADKDLH